MKKEELKKKIREALRDFAHIFASEDDAGEWWGHDTNLGTCKEEFKLATKAFEKLFKSL